ncbi:putative sodium/metabolite cotransporter BASS1, chloroplastic [Tetrabaena socialis]|uniref:Putative sodium/metabolite cotransporter BASS1, chloroplastic n=1 Tax=Tetrabaena socialis TaxID=47790 RepID=A0A2J8A7G9_9CHLO|nr:putative sodium/metabolite cotransporter BASS1, chloroplastic [Tetrabaena socialis]|eukprot:PNH08479.1 putative sodium/metabolite cotransporter BASS1, chloroplastic [Tetrabaena socialis]
MSGIAHHALFAACLPLAAGAALSALLPGRLGAAARQVGPAAAASMIVLTASTKTAANAAAVTTAGLPVVGAVVALHVAALVLGYLIPAGVGAPGATCRTTALQASMRNPALGLGLAAALFGGSPHFPLLAAPCIISIFVQNTLGAWVALAGSLVAPSPLAEGAYGSQPMSPRAGRVLSADGILRQVGGQAGRAPYIVREQQRESESNTNR